jgi:DNA-binding NarL/FixJ family response regulator
MKTIKILLSGYNMLFMDSLRTILDDMDEYSVATVVRSGVETIRSARRLKPDVIIADMQIPDINMLSVVREVTSSLKKVRFVFLVGDDTSELVSAIGEAETVGVLRYESELEEFIKALGMVAKGVNYINSETIAKLRIISKSFKGERDPLSELTYRERDVLYWLSHGYSNREIAEVLVLSEKTIKTHVSHILKKLRIDDRTKAAAIAWKDGLPLMSEEFFK